MKKLLLAAAIVVSAPSFSSATTITFDDLPMSNLGTPIGNGYGGLNWNNWYVLDTSIYGNGVNGYAHGLVSSPNVAYNSFGGPATFSAASGAFTLDSFYLTAAWNNNLDVTVQGYNAANVLVNTSSFQVSTFAPTLETFNWTNLGSVTISTSGGVSAGLDGVGTHVALDNLTINGSISIGVPEISTWAMMLAGFAGLGLVAARRAARTARHRLNSLLV